MKWYKYLIAALLGLIVIFPVITILSMLSLGSDFCPLGNVRIFPAIIIGNDNCGYYQNGFFPHYVAQILGIIIFLIWLAISIAIPILIFRKWWKK